MAYFHTNEQNTDDISYNQTKYGCHFIQTNKIRMAFHTSPGLHVKIIIIQQVDFHANKYTTGKNIQIYNGFIIIYKTISSTNRIRTEIRVTPNSIICHGHWNGTCIYHDIVYENKPPNNNIW